MSNHLARLIGTVALLACGFCLHRDVAAQVNVNFNADGPAAWNVYTNWDTFIVPEAQYNEIGVIGGDRFAFVDDMPPAVGGILVSAGTLEIRSGGNLTAVPNTLVEGNLIVGQAGIGNLVVRRGGTLAAEAITTGGGAATQIVLGEIGGNGIATLSVSGGSLNRTTQIVGQNVHFSSSGDLAFGMDSILVPVITGQNYSTINVSGSAALGGTVQVQFDGYSPLLGDAWDLVTAGTLSGGFALDLSQAPATPRGVGFSITQTATTATLELTNQLFLIVDRGSGAVSIENLVGDPIDLDAYTIASPSGYLNGSWNSLQDQGIGDWDEADRSDHFRLTEFNPLGSSTLNAGSSIALGSPFAPPPPTAFGESQDELVFEYAVPGQGTVTGVVEYTGPANNLVLTIDPATGEAAIQNESRFFDIQIDAYTITSATGRLLADDGNWNSLQDQGLGDWDEADNADHFRLTEFNPLGATLLEGGGTVLNLGTSLDVSGGAPPITDLAFEFAIAGGPTHEGLVVFGPLPSASLDADFDTDGDVDGDDFLAWQGGFGLHSGATKADGDADNDGDVDGDDFLRWQSQFGSGSGSTLFAVPEPASSALAVLALVGSMACSGYARPRATRSGNRRSP